jgi:hypothetical protein
VESCRRIRWVWVYQCIVMTLCYDVMKTCCNDWTLLQSEFPISTTCEYESPSPACNQIVINKPKTRQEPQKNISPYSPLYVGLSGLVCAVTGTVISPWGIQGLF